MWPSPATTSLRTIREFYNVTDGARQAFAEAAGDPGDDLKAMAALPPDILSNCLTKAPLNSGDLLSPSQAFCPTSQGLHVEPTTTCGFLGVHPVQQEISESHEVPHLFANHGGRIHFPRGTRPCFLQSMAWLLQSLEDGGGHAQGDRSGSSPTLRDPHRELGQTTAGVLAFDCQCGRSWKVRAHGKVAVASSNVDGNGEPTPKGWVRPWEKRTTKDSIGIFGTNRCLGGEEALKPETEDVKGNSSGDPSSPTRKQQANRDKRDARKKRVKNDRDELLKLRQERSSGSKGKGKGKTESGEQLCFSWNNNNGACGGLECKKKVKRVRKCTKCQPPGHPSCQ